MTCYACGGPHKKGDPSCTAGPFDVHSSAPAEWKQKQEEKKRKYGGRDEGSKGGNAQPTKYQRTGEKKHCWNYDFGKGSCRNGAKCNFLHEKGEGQGQGKGIGKGKGGKGKNDNKQRNQVASMVATELKKQTTKLAKKRETKSLDETERMKAVRNPTKIALQT